MQGTAKTFMVAQLEAYDATYYGQVMSLTGFQHAIATLGVHFKEQDQEETVRVAPEYRRYSR
eukprot:9563795-Prorocentrum_lima.AAC.1